jgi:hypothetical protein
MEDVDLKARIEATLGTVTASDLAAHLRRDAVLEVDGSVDLVACALAIAKDDAARVAAWLTAGVLKRLEPAQREAWLAASERRWRACVVQPFVLAQDMA